MEKWYSVLEQVLEDPLPDIEIIHEDARDYVLKDDIDFIRRNRYRIKIMRDECIENDYTVDTLNAAKQLACKLAKRMDSDDYIEVEDSLINSGIADDIVFRKR